MVKKIIAENADAGAGTASLDPPDASTADATTSREIVAERYEPALSLDLIVESPDNPRRHFDAEKLADLAASIRLRGVIEPVVVRPAWRGEQEVFELASGHRRRRASKLAGASTIPAIIRVMTEPEFLEALTITNLQREDVNPIEEAEGFHVLLEKGGFDVESLALKIGKSESFVYGRLKLLELTPAVREALARDFMGLAQATELGKVDADAQHEALRVLWTLDDKKLTAAANGEPIVDEDGEPPLGDVENPEERLEDLRAAQSDLTPSRLFRAKNAYRDLPHVSVAEVRAHLISHVFVQLTRAPFDTTSAELVPTAGACLACPKRSGAAPTLFPEINGVEVCLDRACYHAKTMAHISTVVERERERLGVDVVRISREYRAPKGVLKMGMYKPLGPAASSKPAKATAVGVYIDGEARGTAVWIASAKALLEQASAGKSVKPQGTTSSSSSGSPHDYEAQRREQEEQRALQLRCCNEVQDQMLLAIGQQPLEDHSVLQTLAKMMIVELDDWKLMDSDRAVGDVLCELFALSASDRKSGSARRAAFLRDIEKADAAQLQQCLFVLGTSWSWHVSHQIPRDLMLLAEVFDVDVVQIVKDTTRDVKAERKATGKEAGS